MNRRAVLRGAVGATTVGVAVAANPVGAQAADEPDYGGWLEDTSNYDGTVDKTGQEAVTIAVGAEGNGGNFAFDPAAVRVDPDTTITWEWTGNGSLHNVVDEAGSFESEMTDEAGHTFEHAIEGGITKYACAPHQSVGMKGALVVGGASGGDATNSGLGDALAVGGGLGLVGVLVSMFAFGARSKTRE